MDDLARAVLGSGMPADRLEACHRSQALPQGVRQTHAEGVVAPDLGSHAKNTDTVARISQTRLEEFLENRGLESLVFL